MRHFTLKNFRGIEVYADVTDLDRGSLRSAVDTYCLPRGTLSSGVVWRSSALPGEGITAFDKRLDYLDTATANGTPGEYMRSRAGFEHEVNISQMSNKGAVFMAGDLDHPNRVWIAEPTTKRETLMTGLDSARLSYVDIINVGPSGTTPTVHALTAFGPYIYAHHNYGVTALYDVDDRNDPVTGYRVRQAHTPLPVGIAHHACAFGDVYLGYDGQIWRDNIEVGPPEKYESQREAERVPSYKSTGGFEHLLASGWQSSAFAEWMPQLGIYVFFVPLLAGGTGMFVFDRPTLTLTGPMSASGVEAAANPRGTDLLFIRASGPTYAWADFGELREKELSEFGTTLPVTLPFGRSSYTSIVELNWEDLGNPNVHKSFEEVQLNFQQGSYGQVALEIENERGQTSGSLVSFQDFSTASERVKFFVNLNGRRARLRLHVVTTNGRPWVLRDIAIGYTPGVEL